MDVAPPTGHFVLHDFDGFDHCHDVPSGVVFVVAAWEIDYTMRQQVRRGDPALATMTKRHFQAQ